MGTKNDPGAFDCYEAAEPDEPMFVLLARDPFAPALVDLWAAERTRLAGEMTSGQDAARTLQKVDEARACAHAMRQWRIENDR